MSIPAKRFTYVLLIIYALVLTWVLLFKMGVSFSYMDNRSVNLLPFHGKQDAPELILNLVIFIPLGIYVGLLFNAWGILQKLLCIFLVSLTIEVIQFLWAIGAFDITDIVMNTSGGMTGFMLLSIIQRIFSNPLKAHRYINAIAAIGTLIFITLLILLKLNLLPIRYQ